MSYTRPNCWQENTGAQRTLVSRATAPLPPASDTRGLIDGESSNEVLSGLRNY